MGLVTGLAIGAAALGAGASALSQNSASRRAAETSQQNTEANVALARDIYGQNRQMLDPFVQRGNAAGGTINALLGLGGAPAPQPAPNALAQFQGPSGFAQGGRGFTAGLPYGIGDGAIMTGSFNNGQFTNMTAVPQTPGFQARSPQQAANDAFDIFRGSTGYQFRLGEGLDALNSGFAGSGLLQSGAAMRGALEYGQNFASNEFANYLNALGSQQAVGAGAASSAAGVGQNFAGTVINSNNQNAQNQMAAQLSRQNPLANVFGTIGGAGISLFGGK